MTRIPVKNRKNIIAVLQLAATVLVVLCSSTAQASIERADKVLVLKKERALLLLKNREVLKSYRVALGKQPKGHKSCQGDCRTPEGSYVVDARNDRSRFYRSLHISYPNSADLARARKNGVTPGRDIMIHGLPRGGEDLAQLHTSRDWTKGCIAVSNGEMDEIWRLVPNGTPIEIRP